MSTQTAGTARPEMVAWLDGLIAAVHANGWALPAELRVAHRHANSAWSNGIAELPKPDRCHLTLHVGDSALDAGFVLVRELAKVMAGPALATKLRHHLTRTLVVPLLATAGGEHLVAIDPDAAYSYCLVRDRGQDLPWPPDLALTHPAAAVLAAKVRQRRNRSSPSVRESS